MAFMYSEEILKEVREAVSGIRKEQAEALETEIEKAGRIFCDGLGRSGLCCKGFAMRLMHLGLTSYYVGETVTPSVRPGDLLLVCSGSGNSEALVSHARKAKANGARLAVVTGKRESTLGMLADVCIVIASPGKDETDGEIILPMGSLFEGASSLFFENMVLALMQKLGETSGTMFERHANLE